MKRIFKYLGGEKDPNLSQSHSQESESSSTVFQQQIGSSKKDTITQFSGTYHYHNYYLLFMLHCCYS